MRRLLGLVGVATSVALAVPAHADPDNMDTDFLTALTNAGITYRSGDQAVAAAKQVCAMMDQGQSGADVAQQLTRVNPGFAPDAAAKFTALAATAYCPQYVTGVGPK